MLTWEFSAANAIYSTLFTMIVLGGLLWLEPRRLRVSLEREMEAFRQELAPISKALGQIAAGFLAEKIEALERQIDRVSARMQHMEELIERSQRLAG